MTESRSILERVALGAYDAEQAELEDTKHDQRWQDEALGMVRQSPLAGWFPVRWQLIDHNLHQSMPSGGDRVVAVEPEPDDDDQGDQTDDRPAPIRFLVVLGSGTLGLEWTVGIVDPDGGDYVAGIQARKVRTAADVGRWLRWAKTR